MSSEIVIIGGGYAAVWGARAVLRALRAEDARVTIVSASAHHEFHGWTGEVLTGHVRLEHARTPLVDLVPDARVLLGRVISVDLGARSIEVSADRGIRSIRFDHLLLAAGSSDASGRVPGLREHGWTVKGEGALAAYDSHLSSVVGRAVASTDDGERTRLLTVVVGGAGLAGIELATATAQRLRAAVAAEPRLAGAAPAVHLISADTQTLPGLRPRFGRLADYATRQAERAGVRVHRGRRLAEVSSDGARLDGGAGIPSATVVSAIGQTPVALPGTESLARDDAGRVVTDRFLSAGTIWAAGDVAAVPRPGTRETCPPNALWAIYAGRRAGRNIARAVTGRRPAAFRFPGLGQAASLGVGRGAAELYGVTLTGWVAWLARWGFFHWFMPSRRQALASARDWLIPRSRVAPQSGVSAALQPLRASQS